MPVTMLQAGERIRNLIEEQLLWDSRIDSSNIRIDIDGATVRLSGHVPNYAALRSAGTDALLIPGVKTVDNQLQVRYRSERLPGDGEIESHLRSMLEVNASLFSSSITVAVTNGTVLLKGSTTALWQKQRIEQITADVIGVTGIIDKIRVLPTEAVPDDFIDEDLRAAIERTAGGIPRDLRLRVSGGVVSLSGSVPDRMTYRTVEKIAAYTSGVIDVLNHLVISPRE